MLQKVIFFFSIRLAENFCSEIQGYQMTHVFVDPEVKLVTRITTKFWNQCTLYHCAKSVRAVPIIAQKVSSFSGPFYQELSPSPWEYGPENSEYGHYSRSVYLTLLYPNQYLRELCFHDVPFWHEPSKDTRLVDLTLNFIYIHDYLWYILYWGVFPKKSCVL